MQKTWENLQLRRAAEHRQQSVRVANQIVRSLSDLGVKALIFGSLTESQDVFRPNSDIDICILDLAGIPVRKVEDIICASAGPSIKVDLVFVDDLKPAVREEVLAKGVTYVQ